MGTRSSRLQEEAVSTTFDKDGLKRESCRRLRSNRPTSLMVDFSGSFEHDSEANRSRSEEGSDSDTGQQASADGSPADHHTSPSLASESTTTSGENTVSSQEGDVSPGDAINNDVVAGDETGRVTHRTFSERLPGGRHTAGRNVTARSARVRGARPMSEAWIGLYRVNNRHGSK